MTKKYFINGWREHESYFKSFGFSDEEIEEMENGKTIVRGSNMFEIEVKR